MLELCFPVNNKGQTMFTPIFISDNNTRVNPFSKKLKFSSFIDTKSLKKKWEKNNSSLAFPCRIKKSRPQGQNLNRDSASQVPGYSPDPPSSEISQSYMDTHDGLL